MNQRLRTYLPAIIVVMVAISLLLYQTISGDQVPEDLKQRMDDAAKSGQNLTLDQMKEMRGNGDRGEEGLSGWMKQVGNVTLLLGTIAFLWLRFKKSLASKIPVVKKVSRVLYNVHTYVGWAAVVLTAIHGSYFLYTKGLGEHDQLSGIAVGILLLTLALYGYVIRKIKNKWTRQVHKWLSFTWIIALALHAGGFFVACVVATVALWLLLTFYERRGKQLAM